MLFGVFNSIWIMNLQATVSNASSIIDTCNFLLVILCCLFLIVHITNYEKIKFYSQYKL